MNSVDDRDLLFESVCAAYRARDLDGRVEPSPAWLDLAPGEREAAFDVQDRSRRLEALLDPAGLSATGRAVVERARGLAQLGEE